MPTIYIVDKFSSKPEVLPFEATVEKEYFVYQPRKCWTEKVRQEYAHLTPQSAAEAYIKNAQRELRSALKSFSSASILAHQYQIKMK